MTAGYYPVVGTSVSIARSDGHVALIVPKDEKTLGQHGWADDLVEFEPASMKKLTTASEQIVEPLGKLLRKLKLDRGRVGYEGGAIFEPMSYVAMEMYGGDLENILPAAAPNLKVVNAHAVLHALRGWMSQQEIARVRAACGAAATVFDDVRDTIATERSEAEIAAVCTAGLQVYGLAIPGVQRAGGEGFCMSGPNSADASGAFARTGTRKLQRGDFVLVHCNSHVDGYWTDITRTYSLGPADARKKKIYTAIAEAREAAVAAVHPGATGGDVDRAARDVMKRHGFENEFRHGTGHGVGLIAINHNSLPRIHPKSRDVLEPGMVFNVEPAIYIDGYGGARHCDMVAVTETGAELLTPFHPPGPDLWLK
jgi:Xaa-Pro aminopeptidase